MKIDFNGIIDLEIPTDDELLKVYESVKAQMDEESAYNLLKEIGERTAAMEKSVFPLPIRKKQKSSAIHPMKFLNMW